MEYTLYNKKITREYRLMTTQIKDDYLIENFKKMIDDNINEDLTNKSNVLGKMTNFDCFVKNPNFVRLIKLIKEPLKLFYGKPFEIINAWGNVLNVGDKVIRHDHLGASAFSGIVYLTEDGPGTYFPEIDTWIEEKIGKVVLFHPSLLHEVNELHSNDETRYTLSFNADMVKDFEKPNNEDFINL